MQILLETGRLRLRQFTAADDYYAQFAGFGTWAAEARPTGPDSAQNPGGSGAAQVEYALTRAQWAQARRDRPGAADLTQPDQA